MKHGSNKPGRQPSPLLPFLSVFHPCFIRGPSCQNREGHPGELPLQWTARFRYESSRIRRWRVRLTQGWSHGRSFRADCTVACRQGAGLGRSGFLLIVSANFVLRKKLEHTPLPDYPMFHAFPDIPGWKLLLPLDWGEATGDSNLNGTVHWCTTGLVVLQLLVQHFSLTNVFYALNAALIVASFALSWSMFRSAIFSFTLTLCMAFGTQFHWAYACSPVILLYLFVIYLEANLLCFVKLLQTGGRGWRIAFPLTLIPVALCTELWADYLAFLTLGSLFLFAYAWRHAGHRFEAAGRLRIAGIVGCRGHLPGDPCELRPATVSARQ